MKDWKKTFWRSELQQLIRDCLRNEDMTLHELLLVIRKTTKIKIHYAALASIIKVTEGVVVKTRKFSDMSQKIINIYSLNFLLDKEQPRL